MSERFKKQNQKTLELAKKFNLPSRAVYGMRAMHASGLSLLEIMSTLKKHLADRIQQIKSINEGIERNRKSIDFLNEATGDQIEEMFR